MNPQVFLLVLLPFLAYGHLCLIWPPQRGGWNAATAQPGDDFCFQPHAPCGTKSVPLTPTDSLVAGSTVYVKFQQNLNHYNPGWPGFLDIGYAVGTNHSSDDGFQILAQIPDYWPHSQATQTNFSVPIQIPSTLCEWCSLRVRYHPNKPTEPIFHNCADIKIHPSSAKFPKSIFGFTSPSKQNLETTLVEILNSGNLKSLPFSINVLKRGAHQEDLFLAEGIAAPHNPSQSVFFIGDKLSNFENGMYPSWLFRLDLLTTAVTMVAIHSEGQWNSLIATSNNLIGVQQLTKQAEMYYYAVSLVSFSGEVTIFGQTDPESTFVNFFWADFDPISETVYILSGDEDSLYTLDAVLHSINLSGFSTNVPLNNTYFTLSNLHVDPNTGTIYSISQGLYGSHNWSVVVIDPKSGAVTLKAKIDISSNWTNAPGGGIYNGFVKEGQIIHTFQSIHTDSTILAVIDISSGAIIYHTDINMGVNHEKKLFNLFAIQNPELR